MHAPVDTTVLTPRWYPLRYHPEQARFNATIEDPRGARFIVMPAGRRSGKTEVCKRGGVRKGFAIDPSLHDGRIVFAAPTYNQAKTIYWNDLKALVPRELRTRVSESNLSITLLNGCQIQVMGMERPERIEGAPLDGIVLDEYANMKPEVWEAHVLPALGTPGRVPGWAWLIGVPEGRNHYYDLFKNAKRADWPDWDAFHWLSRDVVDPSVIEAAKRIMDPLTFKQEWEGSFVSFMGRAYYQFDTEVHAVESLTYDPRLPLIMCFDFNVSPGVCVIAQEQEYTGNNPRVSDDITAVIGQVYIPRRSNTKRVCRKIIEDWKHHDGPVHLYGDATGGEGRGAGGSRHTAAEASDWTIIKRMLGEVWGDDLVYRVPLSNPSERTRVNAVNSRLRTTDNRIHMLVDPEKANQVVRDLDNVATLEGGSGELDKKSDETLTHPSDALGYYIAERFPVHGDGSAIDIQ